MSQQWNPTDILQLSNVGQCLGYAPSKGRRCRVSIRYHDIRRCQTLITEMAEQRPEPCVLKPMLECLAAHGLCVRFHQYQVDDMVRKWNRMILSAYPPIPLDLISNEISSVMSSTSSPYTSLVPVSRQSTSALTASSVSLPDHSEVETLQDTIAVMQETIRTAQRRLEVLRYTPPVTANVTPSISRVSTSDISSLQLSRSSTIQSYINSLLPTNITRASTISAPTPRPDIGSEAALSSTAMQASTQTASPPTTSATGQPITQTSGLLRTCGRSHVRRMPLEEECPICYDDTEMSECSRSEIIWCRSGCGRSVHASCFEGWRTQCTGQEQSLTCVLCRTPWAEDCSCEGCTVTHVRRQEVEGECSICRQDLRPNEQDALVPPVLSWCKSGCGRSVHQECFESWQEAFGVYGWSATCTDCRTVWVDECEC
jgi:hypothetical protein